MRLLHLTINSNGTSFYDITFCLGWGDVRTEKVVSKSLKII